MVVTEEEVQFNLHRHSPLTRFNERPRRMRLGHGKRVSVTEKGGDE